MIRCAIYNRCTKYKLFSLYLHAEKDIDNNRNNKNVNNSGNIVIKIIITILAIVACVYACEGEEGRLNSR